jgi:DNA-3-methyladenine glycosylase I
MPLMFMPLAIDPFFAELISPEILIMASSSFIPPTIAISNAKAFMEVQREFGSFSSYLWAFVNHKPIINLFKKMEDVPATSSISDKLSKDMKNRGFKFVGSTVIYAHMQACGMVNDHLTDCFRHPSNQ